MQMLSPLEEMEMEVHYSNQKSNIPLAGFCVRALHYCSISDSRWMGFISLSFILIYCNQTALSLMACDKELSALLRATRGEHALSGCYPWPVSLDM